MMVLWWILLYLTLADYLLVTYAEVKVEPGGSVIAGYKNIYGNNVTYRGAYLPSGAIKSWIDLETKLTAGYLKKYFFYVHNIRSVERYDSMRLQIWRAFPEQEFFFTLLWEKEVTVRLDYPKGALYTFELDEPVSVEHSDRIGWQNEEVFGPISFNFGESHHTYFRQVNGDAPLVGEHYYFRRIHLSGVFSVAVEVDEVGTSCAYCSDGGCVSTSSCRECRTGFKPPRCQEVCDSGYYSVNCTEECSVGCKESCDPMSGRCSCQKWWKGDRCTTEIESLKLPQDNPISRSSTDSSALMRWRAISNVTSALGQYYQYAIEYKEGTSSTWVEWQTRYSHDPSPDQYQEATLSGLMCNTAYDVRVKSYRCLGDDREETAVTGETRFQTYCAENDGGSSFPSWEIGIIVCCSFIICLIVIIVFLMRKVKLLKQKVQASQRNLVEVETSRESGHGRIEGPVGAEQTPNAVISDVPVEDTSDGHYDRPAYHHHGNEDARPEYSELNTRTQRDSFHEVEEPVVTQGQTSLSDAIPTAEAVPVNQYEKPVRNHYVNEDVRPEYSELKANAVPENQDLEELTNTEEQSPTSEITPTARDVGNQYEKPAFNHNESEHVRPQYTTLTNQGQVAQTMRYTTGQEDEESVDSVETASIPAVVGKPENHYEKPATTQHEDPVRPVYTALTTQTPAAVAEKPGNHYEKPVINHESEPVSPVYTALTDQTLAVETSDHRPRHTTPDEEVDDPTNNEGPTSVFNVTPEVEGMPENHYEMPVIEYHLNEDVGPVYTELTSL